MLVALGVTALLIVGFAIWQGGKPPDEELVASGKVEGVVANPESYDLGSVPIKGGNVVKTYEVKNTTESTLKLKKIATSCMCTKAKIKIGDKETKFFGMEGHGDKNPPVNLEISAGTVAQVTVEFDPAAHGPQGVGPFDRTVWLTFSDPEGVKELKFSGKVIN